MGRQKGFVDFLCALSFFRKKFIIFVLTSRACENVWNLLGYSERVTKAWQKLWIVLELLTFLFFSALLHPLNIILKEFCCVLSLNIPCTRESFNCILWIVIPTAETLNSSFMASRKMWVSGCLHASSDILWHVNEEPILHCPFQEAFFFLFLFKLKYYKLSKCDHFSIFVIKNKLTRQVFYIWLFSTSADHAWNFKVAKYRRDGDYDSNMFSVLRAHSSTRAHANNYVLKTVNEGDYKKHLPIYGMDNSKDCLLNPNLCEDGFSISFWSRCKHTSFWYLWTLLILLVTFVAASPQSRSTWRSTISDNYIILQSCSLTPVIGDRTHHLVYQSKRF